MKALDAIKRGFEIAGKNLSLILIIFIFNLIWNWGIVPFAPQAPAEFGAPIAMTPAMTVLSILFVLASIFIQGGLLGSVKDIVKEGKMVLGRFAAYGAKFYLKLLGLALVIILIIAVIGFLATLIVAASAPTKNAVVIVLTSIAALAVGGVGIYLVILLFLAPYILVIEDTGVFQAMRISIDFVRGLFFKVIGLGALLVLISFGISFIIGMISGILALAVKGKPLQFIAGILNSGVSAYLSIFITSCLVTYYLAMKGGESKGAPSA